MINNKGTHIFSVDFGEWDKEIDVVPPEMHANEWDKLLSSLPPEDEELFYKILRGEINYNKEGLMTRNRLFEKIKQYKRAIDAGQNPDNLNLVPEGYDLIKNTLQLRLFK